MTGDRAMGDATGRLLRELRESMGLSAADVCRAAGVTTSELSLWETGKRGVPRTDRVQVGLAQAFGVSRLDLHGYLTGELQLVVGGEKPTFEPAKAPLAHQEVVTLCDGYRPLRDANKLLKAHGLVLRWRKGDCGGDQVLLRVEKLEDEGGGR